MIGVTFQKTGMNKFKTQYAFAFFIVFWFLSINSAVAQNLEFEPGVWRSNDIQGCQEVMTILGPDMYLLESGEQMVTKYFEFRPYRKTDYFIFFQRTLAVNDATNCGGVKAAGEGTRLKVFARFNENRTVMRLYAKPDEAEDLGVVFHKQLGNQPDPTPSVADESSPDSNTTPTANEEAPTTANEEAPATPAETAPEIVEGG